MERFSKALAHPAAGTGSSANPYGVAIDSSGNVWVADTANDRIQEFTSGGAFIQTFGTTRQRERTIRYSLRRGGRFVGECLGRR